MNTPIPVLLMLWTMVVIGCRDGQPQADQSHPTPMPSAELSSASAQASPVRFATFNTALNRTAAGALAQELQSGKSVAADKIATIIQLVRPDVLLLNEFDYDADGVGITAFREKFLSQPHGDQQPIDYPHVYFRSVNTGVDSEMDLNDDGKTGTAEDCFGYGAFPGQYGMVVLSRYPIDIENVRTFQKFLWSDMPAALWPIDPATKKSYYSDAVKSIFRLSSKSHWDVPVRVGDRTIHFLVSHPTPPVFDGPEDRNGCRNHDEIRLWADYVNDQADYVYDDFGKRGGLAIGSAFVIAGDQNADPIDGDSSKRAANQLTEHSQINSETPPRSDGGVYYATQQGGANEQQQGDPALDTGDFNDQSVGNMRIDYCLPSKSLKVLNQGVFWPRPDQLGGDWVDVSDHRLVWIDVE